MREQTIYALGFFDGVHTGHQALLRACREMAAAERLRAGVITFTTHPDTLLQGRRPALINTPADRKRLFQQYQMDTVEELPFDRQVMQMPWQDFLQRLIREHGAAGFVCGDDFRFGHKGEGTAQLLQQYCLQRGIPCTVVPAQRIDGITVSSTHIRTLLEQGQLTEAVRFLGHPHILTGVVVSGQQLGRTIGVPTANIQPPEETVSLRHGVYACRAVTEKGCCPAVTNVGTRPTVQGASVTVEAFLLDFAEDLYGKPLTLEFHEFLRPEQKFRSLEELKEQICRDAEKTRQIFG